MNKNILIVMGGGVLVAVLVAVLVQFGLSGNKKVEVVQEDKVNILVASKDLKMGHELGEGDLKWQSWPEGSVFAGAVRRKDKEAPLDVMSGRLSRNISKDEPVLKSALVNTEKSDNFVAASLPEGFRAVAIEVKAHSIAGGFVTPGDFVDVVMTYKAEFNEKDGTYAKRVVDENISRNATETILQNVKVLATDQTAQRKDDGEGSNNKGAKIAKTVTLQVDAVGAEKLALASEMGELVLALRGIGDDKIRDTKATPVVTDVRITNIVREIHEEYDSGTGSSRNQVRVYNGPSVETRQTR